MTNEKKEMFRKIMDILSGLDYIDPEDLPNISLYMDQVTTFMEEQLAATKRYEDDKILTKTMINNYAKNRLLPPPEKKRYTKEHLLMMIFIYYFKNILSISDIQTLMDPVTEKYFQSDTDKDMTYIYREVFRTIKDSEDFLQKDLLKRYNMADQAFADAPGEDRGFLRDFTFICLLSFDVYMKKMLVERLIDGMKKENPPGPKKDKKDKTKDRQKKGQE